MSGRTVSLEFLPTRTNENIHVLVKICQDGKHCMPIYMRPLLYRGFSKFYKKFIVYNGTIKLDNTEEPRILPRSWSVSNRTLAGEAAVRCLSRFDTNIQEICSYQENKSVNWNHLVGTSSASLVENPPENPEIAVAPVWFNYFQGAILESMVMYLKKNRTSSSSLQKILKVCISVQYELAFADRIHKGLIIQARISMALHTIHNIVVLDTGFISPWNINEMHNGADGLKAYEDFFSKQSTEIMIFNTAIRFFVDGSYTLGVCEAKICCMAGDTKESDKDKKQGTDRARRIPRLSESVEEPSRALIFSNDGEGTVLSSVGKKPLSPVTLGSSKALVVR